MYVYYIYIYYIYCNSINYTYINIYVQLYISNKTPQWQGPAKPHVFSHKYHWVQQAIGIQTAARLAQLPNAAKACQTQLASLDFTGSALTHRNVPLENGRSSCTRQGGMLFKKKGWTKKGLRPCDSVNCYYYIFYNILHMWHYLHSTTAAGERFLLTLIDFAYIGS